MLDCQAYLDRIQSNKKDIEAQYFLGKLLVASSNPTDVIQGFKWLQKAAAKDFPPALFYLGEAYEKGTGVSPNKKTANAYYVRAAKLNHCRALCKLGIQAWNKSATDKARYLLSLAIRYGSIEAYYYMYLIYSDGSGNDDEIISVKYLTVAADYGYALAQFQLGNIYEKGDNGVEKNMEKAIEYYILAFKQGSSEAAYRIGQYYRTNGVACDKEKAIYYIQWAYEHNDRPDFRRRCMLSLKILKQND